MTDCAGPPRQRPRKPERSEIERLRSYAECEFSKRAKKRVLQELKEIGREKDSECAGDDCDSGRGGGKIEMRVQKRIGAKRWGKKGSGGLGNLRKRGKGGGGSSSQKRGHRRADRLMVPGS